MSLCSVKTSSRSLRPEMCSEMTSCHRRVIFSMPASSMLALFVRTNCVSGGSDMDCQATLSISVTQCDPLRLRLRFTGQLRQLFMFLVRLSAGASKGKGWPSRCSPGLNGLRLARQHEVSRKFLYQQVHTAEKALAQPRTLKSTRRRPLLPTGHQSLAAATGPGLSVHLP